MTLDECKARWGVSAKASLTGTNVSGSGVVGVANGLASFTDSDIIYSFKVTSTGAADVATLTLSSGSVAQTTGTPTITDGDGNDLEGNSIGTLSQLDALLVTAASGNSSSHFVVVESSNSKILRASLLPQDVALVAFPVNGSWGSLGTIGLTFSAIGDAVTVTVLGKAA